MAQFPWIVQHTGRCQSPNAQISWIPLVRSGFIGVVLVLLVIIVGLQTPQLITMATSIRHKALFTEAGGLVAGNDVKGVRREGRHGLRRHAAGR